MKEGSKHGGWGGGHLSWWSPVLEVDAGLGPDVLSHGVGAEGSPEGGGLPLEGEENHEHVEALGQAEALALLSDVAARFEGRPRPPEAGLEAHLDLEAPENGSAPRHEA